MVESANQEYDALKARLRRGKGTLTWLAASGELFATKRFGKMERLFSLVTFF